MVELDSQRRQGTAAGTTDYDSRTRLAVSLSVSTSAGISRESAEDSFTPVRLASARGANRPEIAPCSPSSIVTQSARSASGTGAAKTWSHHHCQFLGTRAALRAQFSYREFNSRRCRSPQRTLLITADCPDSQTPAGRVREQPYQPPSQIVSNEHQTSIRPLSPRASSQQGLAGQVAISPLSRAYA